MMLHAAAQRSSPIEARSFGYDAFFVHAAADEWFVQGYLLGKLGLSPERVLVPRTLELGQFLLSEIERGVRSSRATIVVLSLAYMADHWAVFGEQIAAYASVARDGYGVLLPLLRDDYELPAHIRALVTLDFRDPASDVWDAEADRLRRLLNRPEVPDLDLPCPYPGMRPFTDKDSTRFFGRDAEFDDLVCRLRRGDRAIYVIGASGSGKSSLIAAGLVPRLSRGVAGLPCFHVCTLRPGEQPLAQLADALEGDPTAPVAAIGPLLARHAPATSLLLIVDQLEELFAVADSDQRTAFFAAVRALRADPRCVLMFTLRSDFYGAFLECPLWTDVDGQISRIELSSLRNDSLQVVIERPAQDAGVYVHPELVSRLLIDAAREPGALPLLQVTLFRLWGKRRQRLLSLSDYQALGDGTRTGLAFAISEHAKEALAPLTPAREAIAFRILLRLVHFGEGRADTRRQQALAALRSDGEDPTDFDAVLQRLVDHRLVTVIGDKCGPVRADLAHEILIQAWSTLAEWIRTWRAAEQRRRELEAAATAWRARGSGDGGLLDAGELAGAVAWRDKALAQLGHTPDLAAFLAASDAGHARAVRQRRRRTWLAFAAVALFAVVTSALALVAHRNANDADRERHLVVEQSQRVDDRDREHRRLLSLFYQASGQLLLEQERPLEALPFMLEARKLSDQEEPSASLRMLFVQAARNPPAATFAHDDPVSSAAFSPDGSRVVTISADHTARVWDTASGKPLSPPLRHQGAVKSAAFSPDGSRVVTASVDRTARVWDAVSGRPLAPPFQHHGAVNGAVFSPDGRRIITASDDLSAQIWDAASGRSLAPPLQHHGAVKIAAFSPDGTRIVTASEDHAARIWDAASGKPLSPPLRHHGAVKSAAFNPGGSCVITISDDFTARIWDTASGKPLSPPLQHDESVNSAAFSPDGTRVVTTSGHSVRFWAVMSGKRLSLLLQHQDAVKMAAFSLDGSRIVTASDDHTARVWDAASGEPLSPPLRHQDSVKTAMFSPDGNHVVTASSDHTARVWDTTPGKPPPPPLLHQHWVMRAVFSPDGSRVVTASFDHTARIWDVASGKPLSSPLQHQNAVNSAAFSPDGSRVVTASSDGTAIVWDATSGKPLFPPLQHQDAVVNAAFSPDGSRIVTASFDHTARIWDATSGKLLSPPLQHQDAVESVAFSPDGTRIVTASDDHTARVWDATAGTPLSRPIQHQDRVVSAAFSPDGSRIVTASFDHTARVWDATAGTPLSPALQHQDHVVSAAFSPEGSRVITQHQDTVWSATFAPDGSRVVTASSDHTARIWDAVSGRPIFPPLRHQGPVNSAAFSADGTRVVTASWDHTAGIWELPLASGTLTEWTGIVEHASPYTLVNGVLPASKPAFASRHP
ncbi:MAG: hypothetical protein E6J90_01785 [Deltaproteobacteria bacterium]|nr:MAG: hypothetical protein E6J90_01785 [Deltaproteobacteria bacterium]